MQQKFLVICLLVFIEKNAVLTLNVQLSNLEENIIHSHLNNQTNLKLFYEKLIESNGIDNIKDIRHKVTDEDIQKENFQDKVN